MMAAKSKQVMQNGSPKELQATCVAASQQPCKSNNALQRVLHLPVVNSACSNLQKTYSVTKQAHPLMASVCGAYERGLQSASSLAAWSMKPVVQKLEPQFAAANALACRGLDHLEQKIPALHQPVEKVTSDLKDSILTHCQSAVRSVRDTLDRVLGLVAKSYEQPKSSMRNTGEYAGTSRVSQLAEAGVDAAIGKLEKLVDFFLPKVNEPPGRCESLERCPTSTFGRIRSLAATAFQRAYKQTTQTIQHTRDKGQELVTWAPGLVGLVGQSTRKVLRILFGVQSPETSWLNKKGQKVPENKRETKKDDKTGKMEVARPRVGPDGKSDRVAVHREGAVT
ncbi:peroxisomal membrane protein 11A isoform X3 [Rhineura floridana]|uniref:peroxisomal membrane protein 11A isoform X3 n=1 Tax=Rhineura floridana TaxID=261503 RepID=UPI002AC803E2|nr:peroxisomal membrane protein 11A isoform X3 [Rhineura floridana]